MKPKKKLKPLKPPKHRKNPERSILEDRFAANVKKFRTRQGMSQPDLADRMKISNAYVSMLETGSRRVTFSMLVKAAEAFGVQPHEMIQ